MMKGRLGLIEASLHHISGSSGEKKDTPRHHCHDAGVLIHYGLNDQRGIPPPMLF